MEYQLYVCHRGCKTDKRKFLGFLLHTHEGAVTERALEIGLSLSWQESGTKLECSKTWTRAASQGHRLGTLYSALPDNFWLSFSPLRECVEPKDTSVSPSWHRPRQPQKMYRGTLHAFSFAFRNISSMAGT